MSDEIEKLKDRIKELEQTIDDLRSENLWLKIKLEAQERKEDKYPKSNESMIWVKKSSPDDPIVRLSNVVG